MRVFTFALFCAAATGVGGRVYAQEAREAVPDPEYTLEDRVLRITQGGSSADADLGCVGRAPTCAARKRRARPCQTRSTPWRIAFSGSPRAARARPWISVAWGARR